MCCARYLWMPGGANSLSCVKTRRRTCLTEPKRNLFDEEMDEQRTSYPSTAKQRVHFCDFNWKKKERRKEWKHLCWWKENNKLFIYVLDLFCLSLSCSLWQSTGYRWGRRGMLFWLGSRLGFAVGLRDCKISAEVTRLKNSSDPFMASVAGFGSS